MQPSMISSDGVARPSALAPNNFPTFLPNVYQQPAYVQQPQPQQPQAPSFDDAVKSFGSGEGAAGQGAVNPSDVAAIWQAFGSMGGAAPAPAGTTPPAPAPAAPAAPQQAPSADPYADMFKDFKPSLKEPELFKDMDALGGAVMSGMPQMDWAATLASEDPAAANATINAYLSKAITRAITASFSLLKSSYEESAPEAFKTSFSHYRTHKQKMAGTNVQAPQGMDVVARALTERYISMRPNADPQEVNRAVGALMGSLNAVLTPKPNTQSAPQGLVDWANFN